MSAVPQCLLVKAFVATKRSPELRQQLAEVVALIDLGKIEDSDIDACLRELIETADPLDCEWSA